MRSDDITSFSEKRQIPSFSACEAAPVTSSHESTRVCCAAVHDMKLSRKKQDRKHPIQLEKSLILWQCCELAVTAVRYLLQHTDFPQNFCLKSVAF